MSDTTPNPARPDPDAEAARIMSRGMAMATVAAMVRLAAFMRARESEGDALTAMHIGHECPVGFVALGYAAATAAVVNVITGTIKRAAEAGQLTAAETVQATEIGERHYARSDAATVSPAELERMLSIMLDRNTRPSGRDDAPPHGTTRH